MRNELFAERHGFTHPKQITYRADLPEPIVSAILVVLYRYTPDRYLKTTVKALFDPYETGERFKVSLDPNVMLHFLKWYELFSLIEHVFEMLKTEDRRTLAKFSASVLPALLDQRAPEFLNEINDLFSHEGVGWLLDGEGKIVTRGDENFTESLERSISTLSDTGRPTAAQHLKSSRAALSERPVPNTAGAVSQATSAVECVLHDITGESMTLGKYLSAYPNLFHPALRKGLGGIYGYASDDGARHGKEGKLPTPEVARFVVATCSSICTLLAEANPKK
jgi:AbiJ N-terminal domain 4